jgi:hypothetical protein
MGGRGRARGLAILGAIAATVLLASGCGESRHANEQRPQVSTRVSVTIVPKGVIVQPARVAFGAEKTEQIPQNEADPQPARRRSREPLNVVFVVANQLSRDTTVQILRQSQQLQSDKVFAHSPGTIPVQLPAGTYTVSAAGAKAQGQITVGSYRASSQNDVLLP